MDKNKAIELLKQALTEIPQLRELHYDNQKFELWHDKVLDIIKAALDADDEQKFLWACTIRTLQFHPQEEYLEDLQAYETALKSIIQKYKILGIEEISKLQKVLQWVNSHLIQRLFQWIKSHKIPSIIITAIMLIAAIITIWGFVSGFFS